MEHQENPEQAETEAVRPADEVAQDSPPVDPHPALEPVEEPDHFDGKPRAKESDADFDADEDRTDAVDPEDNE